MVRYLDPEDHPELERTRKARSSVGERLARLKEKNAALRGTEAIEAAREVALRQLDSRSRSTGELRSAIVAKGFSTETADEVIDRLRLGWLMMLLLLACLFMIVLNLAGRLDEHSLKNYDVKDCRALTLSKHLL